MMLMELLQDTLLEFNDTGVINRDFYYKSEILHVDLLEEDEVNYYVRCQDGSTCKVEKDMVSLKPA